MARLKLLKTQQRRNRDDSTTAELPQPCLYEPARASRHGLVETVPDKEEKRRRSYGLCCVVAVQFPPALLPLNLSRWWARSLDQAGRPCQNPPTSRGSQEEKIQVLRLQGGPVLPGTVSSFVKGPGRRGRACPLGTAAGSLRCSQLEKTSTQAKQVAHLEQASGDLLYGEMWWF